MVLSYTARSFNGRDPRAGEDPPSPPLPPSAAADGKNSSLVNRKELPDEF